MPNSLKQNKPLPHVKRALTATEVVANLAKLEGWRLTGDGPTVAIEKTYSFADFYPTMAFVNALAFIAHAQNHHPELTVHFKHCVVRWHTHDVQGISMADDFDCAARVDALLT
jgi:4a-hydroxytetrahydrobiopterin dehydratase